jgi:alkyldihydroxyacetonephosphate synthase
MNRALQCCADFGGTTPNGVVIRGSGETAGREGSVGDWRDAFIRMPYNMGTTVAMSTIFDTVESSITWERFDAFYAGIMESTQKALDEICGGGVLSCRFTHVYPDGPAPYFTFLGAGKRGGEMEQWQAVKAAACDAVIRLGGTITHHHAVGRVHKPGMIGNGQSCCRGARAAKAALDPQGMLNPGVLIDHKYAIMNYPNSCRSSTCMADAMKNVLDAILSEQAKPADYANLPLPFSMRAITTRKDEIRMFDGLESEKKIRV